MNLFKVDVVKLHQKKNDFILPVKNQN